ncbi:hypothetical protein bmyco0003_37330 [Bacillus pseudomycoides]|nr:hypothetical protein bmyco0002_36260 [Bacillus pseudomycoides]EEM09757.1 hypothetical protein bmyco0003_37330 [Bacillus pseudomycoides]EEM15228.1 hypothetical protein bpmyx0001_38640 [Bacillus pseudomycoides DSM 12442]
METDSLQFWHIAYDFKLMTERVCHSPFLERNFHRLKEVLNEG